VHGMERDIVHSIDVLREIITLNQIREEIRTGRS
jgi:hypothetical protein